MDRKRNKLVMSAFALAFGMAAAGRANAQNAQSKFDPCMLPKLTVASNVTTDTGTLLVAGVANTQMYVCNEDVFIAAGVGVGYLFAATSTACNTTGDTQLTPTLTGISGAALNWAFPDAQGSTSAVVPAGDSLCFETVSGITATVNANALVTYNFGS